MSRKIRFWGALGLLGFLLAGSYWVFGAKAAPNIQLRASFRGLTNPAFPSDTPEYYVDKILNDSQGSYVTDSSNGISVWITPDFGNLRFEFEHHSGRSAFFVFPDLVTACGTLPDTAGVYLGLPDDPVDYIVMWTCYDSYCAGPKLNLLTMPISTPEQPRPQQVRLWMRMCTAAVHDFRIMFNQPDPQRDAGIVEVCAFDKNGDGKPDRWEFSPAAGSNDLAWIYINPSGRAKSYCYFGAFPMPFNLILERL